MDFNRKLTTNLLTVLFRAALVIYDLVTEND